MAARFRLPSAVAVSRVEWLVERAMALAVEEYDDDRAVARLAWLAHDDLVALDQACDICLSYTDVDLGIRGRAIGLLAESCIRTSRLTRRRRRPRSSRDRWRTGRPRHGRPRSRPAENFRRDSDGGWPPVAAVRRDARVAWSGDHRRSRS